MSVTAEVLQRRQGGMDEEHARMFAAIIDAIAKAEASMVANPAEIIGWRAWVIDFVHARDEQTSFDALIEAGYEHVLFLRSARVQSSIPRSRQDWSRMNVISTTEGLRERLARET